MKTREEFIKEFRERQAREQLERINKHQPMSKMQQRVLEKMGVRLKVSKEPDDKEQK